MITRDQLERFSGGPFVAAAQHLSSAADAVNTSQNQAYSAAQTMAYWSGATADAANGALSNAAAAGMNGVEPLSGAGEVVQSFVAAVLLQQDNFNNAMASVRGLKWPSGEAQVQQDGSITKPPAPSVPPQPTEPSSPNPTPFEQAHDGLPPNPAWGTYQNQVNSYNQQVALKNTWETASQQADKLETDLKNALQAAEAADKRAQHDLAEGIKAASDFKVVLAKGLGAPQAEDLYSLGNSLSADGTKWSQQEGASAAQLAEQAANDPAKAAELQQVYGNIVKDDNVFATSLLNTLGAKGLVTLANARANADQIDANNQPGDVESQADTQADKDLDGFLYNALANGTALTGVSGDPGGPDHVSSAFLSSLEQAGQATDDGDPGYYGLGQIFASAQKGDLPMGTALVTTVGSNMIGWVRDTGSYNVGPAGGVANNLDNNPLLGLVNAASLSQSSAQALLLAPLQHADGSTVTGNGSGNNLSWLLSSGFTQGGLVVPYNNGEPLGQLIDVAAAGNSSGALSITNQTVTELSGLYQSSSYVQQMGGLDQPVASLLAQHPQGVWDAYRLGDPSGQYSVQQLGQVAGVITQNDQASQTLQTGLGKYLQTELNQDASNWNADKGQFQADLGVGAQILGFVAQSKAVVGQGVANAQAAAIANGAANVGNAAQIASAVPIPVISVPASVLEGVAGFVSTNTSASQAPTVAGDNAILSLPQAVDYYAANAILTHGSPSDLNGALGAVPPGSSFTQNGKLLNPANISQSGYTDLTQWLDGGERGIVPNGMNVTVHQQVLNNIGVGTNRADEALGQSS